MPHKKYNFRLFLTLITLCFIYGCNNETTEQNFDSEKNANSKKDTSLNAPAASKYLIEPPNPDYSGDYVDKYPNGIIKFSGFFRFGKRHGQWMAFYENGLKWSECFYNNGKREGASTVYFQNGSLNYSGWFKNDLRDSIWFFYDEKTGKEFDKRAFSKDQETGLVN